MIRSIYESTQECPKKSVILARLTAPIALEASFLRRDKSWVSFEKFRKFPVLMSTKTPCLQTLIILFLGHSVLFFD